MPTGLADDLPGGPAVAAAAELGVHALVEMGVQAHSRVLGGDLGEGGKDLEAVTCGPQGARSMRIRDSGSGSW